MYKEISRTEHLVNVAYLELDLFAFRWTQVIEVYFALIVPKGPWVVIITVPWGTYRWWCCCVPVALCALSRYFIVTVRCLWLILRSCPLRCLTRCRLGLLSLHTFKNSLSLFLCSHFGYQVLSQMLFHQRMKRMHLQAFQDQISQLCQANLLLHGLCVGCKRYNPHEGLRLPDKRLCLSSCLSTSSPYHICFFAFYLRICYEF